MIKMAEQKQYRVKIDFRKCGNCGACVAVCPTEALHLDQIKLSSKDENCIGCEFCVITCPADALALSDE